MSEFCLNNFSCIFELLESCSHFILTSKLAQLIFGSIVFGVSYYQLVIARRNHKLNIAKNEIEIFVRLDERQKILVDCAIAYNNENINNQRLWDNLQHAKEAYLNLLDTICLYALNNNITRKNFYTQYKEMLEAVEEIYGKDIEDKIKYKNIQKAIKKISPHLSTP